MKKSIFWKFLIYFIIYSIIGFLLETIYAIFTKGILESRQSFLYGPFCIVYGIAAIVMIATLSKYKNNNKKLFFYGIIVGCTVEYLASYVGELLFHVKWWDYSNDFLNINGRTCLFYAILWGILSIILINYFQPQLNKAIDSIIDKVSNIFLKLSVSIITIFMALDGLFTCYALDRFLFRVANEYKININGVDSNQVSNMYFGDAFSKEKMMMTYPNMIIVNDENEIVYLETVLSDVKNYYYKFGNR